MEAALRKSGYGGVVKEEKRVESNGDEEGCREEIVVKADFPVLPVGNGRKDHEYENLKPSSPKQNALSCRKQVPITTKMERSSVEPNSRVSSSTLKDQDVKLESAKAEMGEVREENQRLKMYLDQIMKDYQTLQKEFHDIVQQEAEKSTDTTHTHRETEEPDQLVSLSLGRTSSDPKNYEKDRIYSKGKENEQLREGLSLGLDCKFEVSKTDQSEHLPNPSPENSFEKPKEEARETWPPSKMLKTMRTGDDEDLQQNHVKRARVSVRARCDTPTMNDGCQWRKYGQKIAKGNPCPRAYYRCTVAPTCPVRKQVQRCAQDMSILITTYEGTHNHPLPMSATAIASTTSAAACMLMSGSSSSRPGLSSSANTTTTAAELHGLNFYLSDDLKSKHFYLSNSSFSSATSHPTITLDLTSTSSSSSSHFNRIFSSYPPTPKYSSTNLNFNSSESNALPMSWGNGLVGYGLQPYNTNQIGSLNLGRQPQENFYQSYMQKNNPTPQQSLPDSIAAATKAITSDPSFKSALAAALTSIIGTNGGAGNLGNQYGGENFGQKLKRGEPFPTAPTQNGNGCASSYLNSSPSTNSQPGSLMFLPPSLPFSTSKSTSASPGDNREHMD